MKEKKESSIINIFIYILIVLFIILIAIPPLTRIFFREENTVNINNSNNNESGTATALTCRKEVVVGTMIYNVTVLSNYSNDTLNKVTFSYEQPEVVDTTVTDNPVLTEINFIRSTGLTEEATDGLSTVFVLTKEKKAANATNTSLDTFFQPLNDQRSNLESLGYTCSTLTA
ncbi:MAG TPA: hypothetical protein IAB59_05380 [Candidatus Onthousia faecipullorum]|uniref:Uncharacterized protein n=1 Tax=Candidatus Onthousia faecipullorum TaxID=2840887 RepID=A0A9D1KCZ7_9FIRM|nr:hypothetical protein [Candidatus Onthousia faecipullorum]